MKKTNIAIGLIIIGIIILSLVLMKKANASTIPAQGEILHFPIHEIDDVPFCKKGKKCDTPVVITGGSNQGFMGRGQGCVPTWTDASGRVNVSGCWLDFLAIRDLLK